VWGGGLEVGSCELNRGVISSTTILYSAAVFYRIYRAEKNNQYLALCVCQLIDVRVGVIPCIFDSIISLLCVPKSSSIL
jgi:hypothetical protein